MSNLAEKITERPALTLVPPLPPTQEIVSAVADKEFIFLAVFLCALQVADGILTGIGVYQLGIDMEANPLLHFLMVSIGTVPTLVLAKGFAIGVIAFLTTLAGTVSWLIYAMRGMVLLYSCAAIIPWSAILLGFFS